jgi:hypothetical protein
VATVIALVAILAPLLALLFIGAIVGFAFHRLHRRYVVAPHDGPKVPPS